MIFDHDDIKRMLLGLPRCDVNDDGYGGTFIVESLVAVPKADGPYVEWKQIEALMGQLEKHRRDAR